MVSEKDLSILFIIKMLFPPSDFLSSKKRQKDRKTLSCLLVGKNLTYGKMS